MTEFYCYEGLRDGATFLLDSTTATAIAKNPKELIGKVVTFTAANTVGYGSNGNNPAGFVEQVEVESNANPEQFVVSVVFNQSREDVPAAGTETAGAFAACDGKGGLAVSSTATNARIWAADKTSKTCTVYIHG